MSGGNLDHTVRSDVGILRERGGKELVIAILTDGGKVFIWKESYQTLVQIDWNLGRELEVCYFTLNQVGIGMVSSNGEVFLAKPRHSQPKAQTPSKPTPAKGNVSKFPLCCKISLNVCLLTKPCLVRLTMRDVLNVAFVSILTTFCIKGKTYNDSSPIDKQT